MLAIWKNDWRYRKDLIKSIILENKSGYDINKYKIKNISSKTAIEFLNFNHIKGYNKENIHIGLYNNKELVSLLSLKKNNKNIHSLKFCNK